MEHPRLQSARTDELTQTRACHQNRLSGPPKRFLSPSATNSGEIFSVMCEADHLQPQHLVVVRVFAAEGITRMCVRASASNKCSNAVVASNVPSRCRWVTTGNLGKARGMTCPIPL